MSLKQSTKPVNLPSKIKTMSGYSVVYNILHVNLNMVLFSFFGIQVKVLLRVSPTLSGGQGKPPILQIDPSKKRVTIRGPVSKSQPPSTMIQGRDGKNLVKTFIFDAAYPQESSQVWFFILITASLLSLPDDLKNL